MRKSGKPWHIYRKSRKQYQRNQITKYNALIFFDYSFNIHYSTSSFLSFLISDIVDISTAAISNAPWNSVDQ